MMTRPRDSPASYCSFSVPSIQFLFVWGPIMLAEIICTMYVSPTQVRTPGNLAVFCCSELCLLYSQLHHSSTHTCLTRHPPTCLASIHPYLVVSYTSPFSDKQCQNPLQGSIKDMSGTACRDDNARRTHVFCHANLLARTGQRSLVRAQTTTRTRSAYQAAPYYRHNLEGGAH